MAKKKSFNFQKWLWIGAVPTALGAILIFSKTITTYAEIPAKVQKIEDYIQAQQQANEIQKEANALLQKIITRDENKEIVLSPDGKFFYSEDLKKWRPIKELKND